MSNVSVIRLLAAALAAACGAALLAVFGTQRGTEAPPLRQGREAPAAARAPLGVAWRVPVPARAGRPCAVANGWIVADAAGGVAKVSLEGRALWRVSFSNEAFEGASESAGGQVVVASASGRVFGLEGETGAEVWRRATDARFQHAPRVGRRGGEPVLWLVSQEDGRLFCLRAADGAAVWTTDETNRCDGEPAAWPGRIAYGNCDGAVYVFDASEGKLLGKVEVGAEEQMAGGIRVLADGRLATGTRSGKLVLVDPEALACVASAKVSESEAFVTPAECFGQQVAMGSEEGDVTLWRLGEKALSPAGRYRAGAAVTGLESTGERLFVLAGGTLVAFAPGGEAGRIVLGDEVGGLAVNAAGEVACVADGALVCVKGGGR